MKILIIVPALDLNEAPAGTIVWWQLLKALNEVGVNVVTVPFIGDSVDTPWWRCYENPTKVVSKSLYFIARKLSSIDFVKNSYGRSGSFALKAARKAFLPSWFNFIDNVMAKEKKIDALMFCSVPINLLESLPTYIERRWGIPSVYYEGDMPDILPSFGGFHFSYYVGADLSEYSLFLSNSAGVQREIAELGAARTDTLLFAADPEIYHPIQVEKNTDIFFSGMGTKFREEWIQKMLINPALKDERIRFSVSGKRFNIANERIRFLRFLPFNEWKTQCCASWINLNISRKPHAETMLSSTLRIFELCSLGACVVSNRHLGLESWFNPGKEIFVLNADDDPLELYHFLLDQPEMIKKVGRAARSRILAEHTYRHRAQKLLSLLEKTIQ